MSKRIRDEEMNLFVMTTNWYILQHLLALANKEDKQQGTFFLHSHEHFVDELSEYFRIFTQKMYQVMYDYTVYVVCNELAESSFECENQIYICSDDFQLYHPTEILRIAKQLFLNHDWSEGYGGENWWEIAKCLTIKNPVLFIDHLVDLQHNTGSALSKPYLGYWDEMSYNLQGIFSIILDTKRYYDIGVQIQVFWDFLTTDTKKFIQRFENLYYIISCISGVGRKLLSACNIYDKGYEYTQLTLSSYEHKEEYLENMFEYSPVEYNPLCPPFDIVHNPKYSIDFDDEY